MTTTVVRFRHDGTPGWGVVGEAGIRRIDGDYVSTGDLLERGREAIGRAGTDGELIARDEVAIRPPITRQQTLICQATNYGSHLKELGRDPKKHAFNVFFNKASSSITGPYDDILKPSRVQLLDYEVELGLVVGRAIDGPLGTVDLADVLAGLVILNDVSARDIQIPEQQFHKGKSFRTFAPIGPYLVLPDRADWSRLESLRLRLSVNDELRQNETAAGMVFKPLDTVTELATVMDIAAGDVIATGTPGGVALTVPPKWQQLLGALLLPPPTRLKKFIQAQRETGRYLADGDVVKASIRTDDGAIDLGEQINRVRYA